MEEKTKDPLIKVRTVIRGKNSKGGDRFQLYIGGDKNEGNAPLDAFIECLEALRDNPKGIKIDLHINKKEYQGRTFDSAFAFVKAVEATVTETAAAAPAPRFRPAGQQSEKTAQAAARVRKELGR